MVVAVFTRTGSWDLYHITRYYLGYTLRADFCHGLGATTWTRELLLEAFQTLPCGCFYAAPSRSYCGRIITGGVFRRHCTTSYPMRYYFKKIPPLLACLSYPACGSNSCLACHRGLRVHTGKRLVVKEMLLKVMADAGISSIAIS